MFDTDPSMSPISNVIESIGTRKFHSISQQSVVQWKMNKFINQDEIFHSLLDKDKLNLINVRTTDFGLYMDQKIRFRYDHRIYIKYIDEMENISSTNYY